MSHIVIDRDTHTEAAMCASGAWAFAQDDTPLARLTAEDGPPPRPYVTLVAHPQAEPDALRRAKLNPTPTTTEE